MTDTLKPEQMWVAREIEPRNLNVLRISNFRNGPATLTAIGGAGVETDLDDRVHSYSASLREKSTILNSGHEKPDVLRHLKGALECIKSGDTAKMLTEIVYSMEHDAFAEEQIRKARVLTDAIYGMGLFVVATFPENPYKMRAAPLIGAEAVGLSGDVIPIVPVLRGKTKDGIVPDRANIFNGLYAGYGAHKK